MTHLLASTNKVFGLNPVRCRRCGKEITNPRSISKAYSNGGLGPNCEKEQQNQIARQHAKEREQGQAPLFKPEKGD